MPPQSFAGGERMTHDIRSAAIKAAERGFAVFPTEPNGKRPRFGLKWSEVATNDPAIIARCAWRDGEGYGVAAKRSGLVIIDLDQPKPGYVLPPEWRSEYGIRDGVDVYAVLAERAGRSSWSEMFGTFTVTTPSGGQHLYFTAPSGRPIGNKPLGWLIDVRGGGDGNGGYVLGPGSILGGRTYEIFNDTDPQPLPGWVADLLDPPRREPGMSARPDDRSHVAPRLDGLIVAVLEAKPGKRNNTLHWAACRAAEMVTAGQLAEDQVHDSLGQAAACIGLDHDEAHRTIASALRKSLRRSA